MKEEFSLDVDENTINEFKKAIGYIEARHKRFMQGKETVDDLMNGIYHFKIKNDKGLDLDVVELKYYKKLVKIINLMAEELADWYMDNRVDDRKIDKQYVINKFANFANKVEESEK